MTILVYWKYWKWKWSKSWKWSKRTKKITFRYVSGTSGASLLRNMQTEKGVLGAGERTIRAERGILRASEGTTRARKGVLRAGEGTIRVVRGF